jgi:predicted secreted protein
MATKIKGQNLRLCVDGKVIALATSCTFHVTAQLEDSSTKDDTGDWQSQEVTGLSWDCSCDALFSITEDAEAKLYKDLLNLMIEKKTVSVEVLLTDSQDSNRNEAGSVTTGTGYISDLSLNAPNRQNATYSIQITGNGPLDNTITPQPTE